MPTGSSSPGLKYKPFLAQSEMSGTELQPYSLLLKVSTTNPWLQTSIWQETLTRITDCPYPVKVMNDISWITVSKFWNRHTDELNLLLLEDLNVLFNDLVTGCWGA